MAQVFLSTITPHLARQDAFLRDLQREMRSRGLDPVRLEFDEYDRRDPIAKALNVIKSCDAVLCVGLARTHAYFLRDKEGDTDNERDDTHRYYTSGWLNMEAGLAFALGKPVLVLCEKVIASDGVFDRNWNSSPPYELTAVPLSVSDAAVDRCLQRLTEVAKQQRKIGG